MYRYKTSFSKLSLTWLLRSISPEKNKLSMPSITVKITANATIPWRAINVSVLKVTVANDVKVSLLNAVLFSEIQTGTCILK